MTFIQTTFFETLHFISWHEQTLYIRPHTFPLCTDFESVKNITPQKIYCITAVSKLTNLSLSKTENRHKNNNGKKEKKKKIGNWKGSYGKLKGILRKLKGILGKLKNLLFEIF